MKLMEKLAYLVIGASLGVVSITALPMLQGAHDHRLKMPLEWL